MGISKVVAVNSTIFLGIAYSMRKSLPWVVLLALLHSSIVGYIVAVASHPSLNFVHLFRKSKNGDFPLWSRLLFSPYMYLLKAYVYLRRKRTDEPVYNKVSEGIYVGGWPFLLEDVPPGKPAVVDCTCELPRSECVKELPYLCVPTWDSRGPSHNDIEKAVRWVKEKRQENRPILIHCAFGHGRSVTVACAVLLSLGVAKSWEDARDMIKTSRPKIRMNQLQLKSLHNWLKKN